MMLIVVGFLDVETAHRAVREAASLAVGLGAILHVVTALDRANVEVIGIGSDQWELSDLDRCEQAIHDFMGGLDEKPEYSVAVIEGRPAEVLVREAERLGADLLVVGNVRMQGPGRILGSVGSAVAHHAPCSVLIAKTV